MSEHTPGLLPTFVADADASAIDHIDRGPFIPSILQPCQYSDLRRPTKQSPEKRLWYAVLENALRDVAGHAHITVGSGGPAGFARARLIAREEALIWFRDLQSDRVASLTAVCELFDLDPRRVLQQAEAIAANEAGTTIPTTRPRGCYPDHVTAPVDIERQRRRARDRWNKRKLNEQERGVTR